jgi:hypothetical protein
VLLMKGHILIIIFGGIFLMLTACQDLPSVSRSGAVKDISISAPSSTTVIQVNSGDEIRWTNRLMTPVRITFLDYVLNRLSCRSNFGGHFYSGADTALQPNESASLCFRKPGTIRYVVRMEGRNGELAESGQVQVGAF